MKRFTSHILLLHAMVLIMSLPATSYACFSQVEVPLLNRTRVAGVTVNHRLVLIDTKQKPMTGLALLSTHAMGSKNSSNLENVFRLSAGTLTLVPDAAPPGETVFNLLLKDDRGRKFKVRIEIDPSKAVARAITRGGPMPRTSRNGDETSGGCAGKVTIGRY